MLVVEGESGAPLVLSAPIGNRVPGRELPVTNHLGVFSQRIDARRGNEAVRRVGLAVPHLSGGRHASSASGRARSGESGRDRWRHLHCVRR